MQTFLPRADFQESARVLDRQRLGKQRVENLQILKALLVPGAGWANHPAVKMWRGYEWSFAQYHLAVCHEWTSRGYRDTCQEKFFALLVEYLTDVPDVVVAPPWLGEADFHRSHQSNLVRKDADHYGPHFPDVGPDLDYVWPAA